jgi:predicted PurR-regulated permease PerM
MSTPEASPRRTLLRVATAVLALAGAAMLAPLWGPLVLAAWTAHVSEPLTRKLERLLKSRARAAAAVTALLVVVILLPVGIAAAALITGATELWKQLMDTEGKGGLRAVVTSASPSFDMSQLKPEALVAFARSHASEAWRMTMSTLGASASAALGAFVFVLGVFTFATDGDRLYRWASRMVPIGSSAVKRLHDAFFETGRGLLIGSGLTALAQALIATIAYVALGVPRAFVLGLVTAIAALIPSIGTALVWVPVAAGLAISGQPGKAVILVVVGAGVVSVIDNLLRPVLARFGDLQLHGFVLLVAIFGGIALAGGWGLLLGPLLVRLGIEALAIAKDDHLFEPASADVSGETAIAPPPSSSRAAP